MSIATFGPGGNCDLFYAQGNKSTTQSPGWVKRFGLDAFEYEAGNGLTAGEASLRAVGNKAREHGILMSLHAPYYISLSGVVEEKRLKSIEYIQKSLWAAELLGADTIVIHSGSAAKISREEAMALSKDTLARVAEHCFFSPAYCDNLFKAQTGMTPAQYRTDVKLKQAVYLLESTDLTVHEIAEKLNFFDAAYFCKVFRSRVGITPKQYVKNKKI